MTMRKFVSTGLAAAAAVTALTTTGAFALADGKAISGLDHSPARFIDESSAYVKLLNQGKDGYRFAGQADIAGVGSSGSVARLDLVQGGKVLATAKCARIDNGSGSTMTVSVTCSYDGAPIKAAGAIDLQLIWSDDTDGKDYLIRDFQGTATLYNGGQSPIWQLVPDDLLGSGYVLHAHTKHEDDGKPAFKFWAATSPELKGAALRCTVDGAKLGDDLDISSKAASPHGDQIIEADVVPAKGDRTTYHWEHVSVIPSLLHYGSQATASKASAKAKKIVWMADHPGQWSCELRKDSTALRVFNFKVNASGMIESLPMQSAKGAAPLFPDVALIDVQIPKESKWDRRVRPDAMKKSRGFGLPWPSDPSVKTIQASFPAASGQPDPK